MSVGENVLLAKQPSSRAALGFAQGWAELAIVGISVTVSLAIAYWILRAGLPTPKLLPIACVLIVAASLLGPLSIDSLADGAVGERQKLVVFPLVSFAILLSVVGGFVLGQWFLIVFVIVAGAGAVRAAVLLQGIGLRALLGRICIGVLIGIYLFFTVHSLGYAGFNTPEQALLGTLNHDTTFHTAIAHLIENFGVPSQGTDGLIWVHYHFGSHIWFAALGALTGSQPIWSYGAGVPLVAAPMLVIALVAACLSVDGARRSLLTYLLVALSLLLLSDLLSWKSYYISESYTFGLVGLLLMVPALVDLSRKDHPRGLLWIVLIAAIAVIPILTLLKTSVGLLWCAAFGWVVLRRFGFARLTFIVGVVSVVVLAVVIWANAPGVGDYRRTAGSDLSIIPFYFFRVYPAIQTYGSYLLPVCLLLMSITGREGIKAALRSKSQLMVEAVVLVLILGSLPPLLGIPQDSAVWYFLNVAQWVALPLLVGVLLSSEMSGFWVTVRQSRLFVPAIVVVAFFALAGTQTIYGATIDEMKGVVLAADATTQGRLLSGKTATQYFIRTLLTEHRLWGSDFNAALTTSPGNRLIESVQALVPTPNRNVAVFIPPENTEYWNMHTMCRDKHNVQVSLTGQPSLFGGPPVALNCDLDAYVTGYGKDYFSRDVTDAELCQRAAFRSIAQVVIVSDDRPDGDNRILDCTK